MAAGLLSLPSHQPLARIVPAHLTNCSKHTPLSLSSLQTDRFMLVLQLGGSFYVKFLPIFRVYQIYIDFILNTGVICCVRVGKTRKIFNIQFVFNFI